MIRRALPEDADWIRDVAADVYAAFGDYRRIIPAWMAHPGVLTFVEEDRDLRRGFILLGFYEPVEPGPPKTVADLLAIAVAASARPCSSTPSSSPRSPARDQGSLRSPSCG
jgi:hypothetical protein